MLTEPNADRIPFERYPGLSPLFFDLLHGLPDVYPDLPTLDAALARGEELLGQPARIPADAFRFRHPDAKTYAEELARGRAVAVITGHQVGLFTGPLFTLVKAFDAIRVARQLTERGLAAVPVFYALTDDHDLQEIARTARPGPEGPEILVLEGADRSNHRPVGTLPIPEKVREIVEAFGEDAHTEQTQEILERFARRSTPGTTYRDAFIETLFDLVDEPLLVLDPLEEPVRAATAELFRLAAQKEADLRNSLSLAEETLRRRQKPVPVPLRPDVFPFFSIEQGERRRISDLPTMLEKLSRGEARASADVLTRPALKSFLMPAAVSILGAAEIAYHAQALSLFPIFGLKPPVLFPRSYLILLGPAERRAAEALGISRQDLLVTREPEASSPIPQAARLATIAGEADQSLASLEKGLRELDPTLGGALETTRRKVAYQLAQLNERIKKAVERKDQVASNRRRRLETMLRPEGTPAERLYPALVPLLAFGGEALTAIREGARGETLGAVIVDLETAPEPVEEAHGR